MWRDSPRETQIRNIQNCDSVVAKTTSDTNPIANWGGSRPVRGQEVLGIMSDVSFKGKKSWLVGGDVGDS